MKRLALAFLPLAAACATAPDRPEVCRAEGLDDLIGRPATTQIGVEAMRRSGATGLRWIQPGDIVTMDYREGRLNIHLDADNRIERFICG